MKKDYTVLWTALLGVLLGVLLALTVTRMSENRRLRAGYQDWNKLNLILRQVQDNYVDTVDIKKVTDAAVVAALGQLDPHSVYLPPVELESSEEDLAGNFEGVGIQFNVPNDTAIVLEVIPGGPSEKAGLLQGDRLLRVDDKVIAGVKFPQDSMVRRMRGPAGTKVTLTVSRQGEEIAFDITRGKIPVHCVDAAFMVDDTTGYLRLSKFSRNTYRECAEASLKLLEQGMTRLLLDLRDNSGGYFDQAISLANLFLEKDAGIVYLEGLHRPRNDYKANGKGILKDVSLTVLINENSASSSEILAGAIQDNDRGLVVGRRSYGKGLVQEPVYFTDGSAIRITVARFHTPSGRCIQKPYSDDYQYDIYKRYRDGEMFDSDSIRIDSSAVFRTVRGRTVYGGGGIVPDVFVPVDTTRATPYWIACNRKATQMRFASEMFDRYRGRLSQIETFPQLEAFLDGIDIPGQFQRFAAARDGISPAPGEWAQTEPYLLPQLRALVGRYSRLGENAFYKLYLPVDDVVAAALSAPGAVLP